MRERRIVPGIGALALAALAATLCCQTAVDAFTPVLPARRLSAAVGGRELALRARALTHCERQTARPYAPAVLTLSVLSLTCVSSASAEHASVGMDLEVLTELLMENGALSVVVEDADYGTERERHKLSKVLIIVADGEHARALIFSEFLPGPSLTSEPGSRAKAGSGCQA